MGKTILISSHILSELATSARRSASPSAAAPGRAASGRSSSGSLHRVLKVRVLGETTEQAAELLRHDDAIRLVGPTTTPNASSRTRLDMARRRPASSGRDRRALLRQSLLEDVFMMTTRGSLLRFWGFQFSVFSVQ
jgi:hypothetical protein